MAKRGNPYAETSKGRRRPRLPIRPGRPPSPASAVGAAPVNDPVTGHFLPQNPGARLRQIAAIGRATAESLLRLPVDSVAPWLRPHLSAAQDHAQRLVDALPAQTEELIGLVGDLARCRLLAAACVTEGAREECTPDEGREWRDESRQWMKEARAIGDATGHLAPKRTLRLVQRHTPNRLGEDGPRWREGADAKCSPVLDGIGWRHSSSERTTMAPQ